MNIQPIIWHNPRCSKSRQTLALLQAHGYQPHIVRYLENPPNATVLKQVLTTLDKKPSMFVRKGELLYKKLELAQSNEEAIFAAMLAHPILIERPVVLYASKVVIGRPPETVLSLFYT